jgi:RNA polymerase sigma factor (sigma-70 family)
VAGLTEAEAEEAASEALAQLVSQSVQAGTFDQLKPLTATIAFRKAVSLARRKSAAKRSARIVSLDDNSLSPESLFMPESPSTGALTDVEAAEMVLLLQKVLGELDPETQLLIEEKHVQGATYEELGARHGLPLGTACAKVARGLKKIRQRLAAAPTLAKELKAFLR